ncbi:DNA damage-inducible SOS regulon protein [Candidatus Pantoea deserta]|uniref:DNA damage-inducible SOS regulon protein n=1 Tax=Candidatus Pantoea deserta TaxID=1869313 RepID=A0A3N4P012_9GAMM|nr:YebG family protein [Pantoea deserta]RPD99798.1 DNA damage-inducible SOS regulon protein [Pantoea deserta]
MAVEIKYVVVRKGEEKMTFVSKKEADAYDKMLDLAEAFTDWLTQHQPDMDESQTETLGLLLAEQKETIQHILRTSKLPDAADAAGAAKKADAAETSDASQDGETAPARKVRAVKAA